VKLKPQCQRTFSRNRIWQNLSNRPDSAFEPNWPQGAVKLKRQFVARLPANPIRPQARLRVFWHSC
jgi:hypothetical protein